MRRRGFRSPATWALALILGAPALARAQQGGLFPLAPIQRERVPCPMEDPVYRLYRQVYFGYHPTCWRQFPPGWGCPSPEAPNTAQELRDHPVVIPNGSGTGGAEPPPERERDDVDMTTPLPRSNPPSTAPRTNENLPALPSDSTRSPFDLDTAPKPSPLSPKPVNPKPVEPSPTGPGAVSPSRPGPSTSLDAPNLPSLPAADDATLPPVEQPAASSSPAPTTGLNELPAPIETGEVASAGPPMLELPDPGIVSTPSASAPPTAVVSTPAAASPRTAAPSPNGVSRIAAAPMPGPNGPSVFNNADGFALPPSAPVQAPLRQGFMGRVFGRFRR